MKTECLPKAKVTFEHNTRTITIKLRDGNNNEQMIETSFDNLEKFLLVSTDTNVSTSNLYLFLHRPVKLSEGRLVHRDKKFDILQLVRQEQSQQRYINRKRTVSFRDCPDGIIGSSTVLNLELSLVREISISKADYGNLEGLLFKLSKQRISAVFASPRVVPFTSDQVASSRGCKFSSFEATYAWFCLESRGYKISDQFSQEFMNLIYVETDYPFLAEVLYNVINITEKQAICSVMEVFVNELKKKKSKETARKSATPDGNQRFVRRLMLTPSTRRGLRGEQAQDNRVIRTFGSDRFISVSIRDEDGQLLTSSSSSHQLTAKMFVAFLMSGLRIGDRHYRYLGSSNSQLREHSVWMYASDGRQTVESIRDWMGDFSGERCVATYVSRLGQCFSDSRETIEVKDAEVIPDKLGNGFTFTDGIGKVSVSLANEVSFGFLCDYVMYIIR